MGAAAKKNETTVAAPKRPKDRLAWLVKCGHIEPDHVALGERILKLKEAMDREPSPRMAFGGGGSSHGGNPADVRVQAGQKWRRLFQVAGPTGEALVGAIIIDGMSLGEAATHLNINPKAVLPMLQYVLNVLERS
jgi:hypothetical protein